MKQKAVVTILGIALVAGAAIFVGRAFLKPASERAEAKGKILSGAYAARIEVCSILEDNELPEGLEPPQVGSPDRYLRVVVLFPEVTTIKGDKEEYRLDKINGGSSDPVAPVHSELSQENDGVVLTLTFATDDAYESGRLVHADEVVVEKVTLQ